MSEHVGLEGELPSAAFSVPEVMPSKTVGTGPMDVPVPKDLVPA